MTLKQEKVLVSEESFREVLKKILSILHNKASKDDLFSHEQIVEIIETIFQDRLEELNLDGLKLSKEDILNIINELILSDDFNQALDQYMNDNLDKIKSKSNYDLWLDAGNIGTIDDFLRWIKADTGGNNNIGEIFWWPLTIPPSDSLYCDGGEVNREEYKDLFDVIGTQFGEGDGETTFNLPDLRGEFIRGYDPNRVRDPEGNIRGLGKHQESTAIPHFYMWRGSNASDLTIQGPSPAVNSTSVAIKNNDGSDSSVKVPVRGYTSRLTTTSNEIASVLKIRPTNINLLPCIRYKINTSKSTTSEILDNTYYVDAINGSDTIGDGTQDNPWETLKFTLSKIPKLSHSTNSTIYLNDGKYTVTADSDLLVDFGGKLNIIGNTTDASKVIVEQITANMRVMRVFRGGVLTVQGITIKSSGIHTQNMQLTYTQFGGVAHFDNCIFEGDQQYTYGPSAYDNGTVALYNCSFTGNRFKILMESRGGSTMSIYRVTIPKSITVDIALQAYHNGIISVGGTSNDVNGISGATITGKKYYCADYSRIGFINTFKNTCTIAGTTGNGGVVY